MRALRCGLFVAVGLGGAAAASAAPLSIASEHALGSASASFESVALVCGPRRCWRQPGWLYLRRPGSGWGWSRTFEGPEEEFRHPYFERRLGPPDAEIRLRRRRGPW